MPPEDQFRLTVTPEPGRCVIRVAGALDLATAPHLAGAVAEAVGRDGCVALDTSLVTLLDAAGVGALIAAAQAVARCGGQFVISSPGAAVCRTLDLLGLDPATLPVAAVGDLGVPSIEPRALMAEVVADGCAP